MHVEIFGRTFQCAPRFGPFVAEVHLHQSVCLSRTAVSAVSHAVVKQLLVTVFETEFPPHNMVHVP